MNDRDMLAELRVWRDEFARSHGYDLGAMVAALRELDVTAGERVVYVVPRPPVVLLPQVAKVPNHSHGEPT